jgi:hypothetical protein
MVDTLAVADAADLPTTSVSMAEDILRGMPAIALFVGLPTRKAYYAAETRQIPAYKRGKIWEMRKSSYRRDCETREREAANRPLPTWLERQNAKTIEAEKPRRERLRPAQGDPEAA